MTVETLYTLHASEKIIRLIVHAANYHTNSQHRYFRPIFSWLWSQQSRTSNDSVEYDMLRSSTEFSSLLYDSIYISSHLVSDVKQSTKWKLRQEGPD